MANRHARQTAGCSSPCWGWRGGEERGQKNAVVRKVLRKFPVGSPPSPGAPREPQHRIPASNPRGPAAGTTLGEHFGLGVKFSSPGGRVSRAHLGSGLRTPRWQGRRTSGQQGKGAACVVGLVNFSRCPSPSASRGAVARVQPGASAAPGHGSGERASRPAGVCQLTEHCAALRQGPAVH